MSHVRSHADGRAKSPRLRGVCRTAFLAVVRNAMPVLRFTLEELGRLNANYLTAASACFLLYENDSNDGTVEALSDFVDHDIARRLLISEKRPNMFNGNESWPLDCHAGHRQHASPMHATKCSTPCAPTHAWNSLKFVVILDLDERPGRVHGFARLLSAVASGQLHAAFPLTSYDTWALRPPRAAPFSWPCKDRDSRRIRAIQHLETQMASRAVSNTTESSIVNVDSAFNGVGVYSAEMIGDCRYVADGDCEHISFHRCLASKGARLGVLPGVHTQEWCTNKRPSTKLQKACFRVSDQSLSRQVTRKPREWITSVLSSLWKLRSSFRSTICPTPRVVWSRGIMRKCCDVYPRRIGRLGDGTKHEGSLDIDWRTVAIPNEERSLRASAQLGIFAERLLSLPTSMRVSVVAGGEDVGVPREIFEPAARTEYRASAPRQQVSLERFLGDSRLVHLFAQNYDLLGCNPFSGCAAKGMPLRLVSRVSPLPLGLDLHTLAEKTKPGGVPVPACRQQTEPRFAPRVTAAVVAT